MKEILNIALGVFIGALAALIVWEAIQTIRLRGVLDDVRQSSQSMLGELSRPPKSQVEPKASSASSKRGEALTRNGDPIRTEGPEPARLKKELAWSEFYEPSPACRQDPTTMECANAHVKARKLFEAQYVSVAGPSAR